MPDGPEMNKTHQSKRITKAGYEQSLIPLPSQKLPGMPHAWLVPPGKSKQDYRAQPQFGKA